MRTLEHIGMPTTTPKEGEMYSEGMKLHIVSPDNSINKIEWLRFDSDSWLHEMIQNQVHLAYRVTNPEAEMEGKEVLLPVTDCGDGNFIAFVVEEGIPVEFMWNVNDIEK